MPAYRGYLVDERGKISVGQDVEATDDYTAIAAVRQMVAADNSARTYEVWRDLELIHAAMAPSAHYPDALGSLGAMAGPNVLMNRQPGNKPRYPGIGLTVTSIGTPPIRQAPFKPRPRGGAKSPWNPTKGLNPLEPVT